MGASHKGSKGGAPLLISNNTILEAALNISSVEGRHASYIRTVRRGSPQSIPGPLTSKPKNWISGDDNGGLAPMYTAPVYAPNMPAEQYPSEANVTQAGVNLVTAFGVTTAEAQEAFN
ncbi:ferritin-like domain-containing protein [Hymenobacter fodinae]|uniref:ferritin-like domain-containing protein n=1 Tax=Hymenobacter fodinae TaxID=2510796 RepID=UPI0021D2DE86|nr:ferritin-like domain-containing protein [Hymenobacter fodinae]